MNDKRILVVDDSPIILSTLSMKLRSHGYEVLIAEDGGGAVSTVRHQRPDLIVLDIDFPPDVSHGGGVPWDGFLVMEWLRRLEEARGIPVIMISGENGGAFEGRARAAGAVGLFQKPIDCESLIALIDRTLGQEAATSEA